MSGRRVVRVLGVSAVVAAVLWWLLARPPEDDRAAEAPRPAAPPVVSAGSAQPPAREAVDAAPRGAPPRAARDADPAPDPDAGTTGATVLWPVTLAGEGPPAQIAPGTLLTVLATGDGRASVRLPSGAQGEIAECALTSSADELAVARALTGSRAEQVEAREKHASAVLAPLLDGRPVELACAPPPAATGGARPGPSGERHRSALEALGMWETAAPRVPAPAVHDWKALAATLGAMPDDAPLPAAAREQARRMREQRALALADEAAPAAPPAVRFPVPPAERRGAYYAFTTTHAAQVVDVALEGLVYPVVDCGGCERGPRRYDGEVVLSVPGASGPAAVVWLPAAAALGAERALAGDAWRVAGERVAVRVPATDGTERELTLPPLGGAGEAPIAVRGGYLTGFPELGLRLLVLATSGGAVCAHGVYVLELLDGEARRVAGGEAGCER